jgi:hypothetical protein
MFQPEDFEISMEKELRLRVINDEINNCDNIEELRKQLITVTRIFTQYQHLLESTVKRLLEKDIAHLEFMEQQKDLNINQKA